MNLERLQQLKQKLIQEKNLSVIWSFYMDEFADLPEFIEVGEPRANPFLEAVIQQICQKMFGKTSKIDDLLIIYIAEYDFFHAPLQVEQGIGGVIYFADVNTGLLAVSATFPPTDEVKYSRFSALPRHQASASHDHN